MAAIVFDGRTIQDYYPGIGRYAYHLARALVEFFPEHQFRLLFTPRAYNSRFDLNALTGFPNFVPIPTPAQIFSPPEQTLGRNPTIVGNARLWFSPYYALPLTLPIPSVVTLADLTPLVLPGEMPNPSKRVLYRGLNQTAGWRARAIVTFSDASRGDLERLLNVPAEKIRVLPLGVDKKFHIATAHEIASVRTVLNLPNVYVLYLGSNKPHKNLLRLLEAWASIKTEAVLVIAGAWDSRYPQAQQFVAQYGLQTRVQFRHNVPEPLLPALISGARVFVFPSVHEGFGLPPLEAMACGTPVVCGHASSLPEVVGEAAIVFDPFNVQDMTATISSVLENANLRFEMRAKGLHQAKQFTWERTARELMGLFQQVSYL